MQTIFCFARIGSTRDQRNIHLAAVVSIVGLNLTWRRGIAMKKVLFLIAACTLVFTGVAVTPPTGEVTLHGKYVWNNDPGQPGDLKAIFSPKKNNDEWEVAFHFNFSGRKHVYSGSAEGSLESGTLKGTVQNERRNRTFFFEGTSDGGNFSGDHSEKGRGTTGTLTLAKN